MEYQCKNSKKEDPTRIYLGDISMQIKSGGRESIVFYSSIEALNLTKQTRGFYFVQFKTIDNKVFTITNRYVHTDGRIEDKSSAYAMFVRVLHMHLRDKSKAQLSCGKAFHIADWQKLGIVILLFGISYWLDFIGIRLFHPAIHGAALSAIALLIIVLSEKNKATENSSCREIPREFLPV